MLLPLYTYHIAVQFTKENVQNEIVKDDVTRKPLLKELDDSARQGRKANLSGLEENTLYVPECKSPIVAAIESSFFGWLYGMK